MDLRLFFAILLAKSIAFVIKLFGGGATAAPGLYALKIDPKFIKKFSKKIKGDSILISGTNGKTTTSRLLSDILSNKYKIIHNRQGSNLLRGIASTLINKSSFLGKLNADLSIWETDEAVLAEAVQSTSPKIIVLLNLFRDQLDRYGEIDNIRSNWEEMIKKLPKTTILILNSDDPGINYLSKFHKGNTIHFGINDKKINLPDITNVADIKHCLICNTKLNYSIHLSAHMGHYYCPRCNFSRINPEISASKINFKSDLSANLDISIKTKKINVNTNLPGLYNIYNLLAACSATKVFNTSQDEIKNGIQDFVSAFGRFQKVKIYDKNLITFLIKNPAGANEVIRTISKLKSLNLLVILNDKIADGKDVSWIWDVDWEQLSNKVKSVYVSGTRAWDMSVRLKYANITLSKKNVTADINYSLRSALNNMNNKDTLIILPTYTGLLSIQKTLYQLGANTKWQKD